MSRYTEVVSERETVRVRDRAQVEQAVRDYHITTIRGRQRHGQ